MCRLNVSFIYNIDTYALGQLIMRKEKIFIFICLVLLSACSPSALDGIVIEKATDGYKLSIDGRETYIKGVGGTYRLDIAAQSGANAFRTWGGNVEEIKKNLALASEHNMYVMQGIGMTKDSIRYYDDEYKNKMREEVRLLAETFKNDTSLLAWGIGNEIELGNANIAAAWNFVEELAQLIKSIDKRHLVSTLWQSMLRLSIMWASMYMVRWERCRLLLTGRTTRVHL